MEGPERTTSQEAALAPGWGKKGAAGRGILGDVAGAKQGEHASSSSQPLGVRPAPLGETDPRRWAPLRASWRVLLAAEEKHPGNQDIDYVT